jgi:hypothetical protein
MQIYSFQSELADVTIASSHQKVDIAGSQAVERLETDASPAHKTQAS